MNIRLIDEAIMREAYRFLRRKPLGIQPQSIEADMVVCLYGSIENPVIYDNQVSLIVKEKFTKPDTVIGFEFNT